MKWFLALLFLVLAPTVSAQSVATIDLDPNTRFQTITGWEATSQSGQEDPSFPLYKDTLFDLATNDLGITRIRLEIGSGAEYPTDNWSLYRAGQLPYPEYRCIRTATINDNNDPNVINPSGFQFGHIDHTVENVILPLKQRLEAQGKQLYINLNYVAFTNQIREPGCDPNLRYIHNQPSEYAEFMLATTLHLQAKYGLVPDAWEIILEPDNSPEWSSGTAIGNALVATITRLSQNGFTPKFIVPSNTNMATSIPYFDALVQVLNANNRPINQYIEELSYHRYTGVSDSNLQAIAARKATYSINTSMLEHIGSGYQDLHKDLKLANNSAWQQFALAFPIGDNGAQYYWINVSNPSSPVVNISATARFLRQYFKYVKPGAVRIAADIPGCTSTSSCTGNFDPLAFINSDGNYVVVVKTQNSGGSFTINNLPNGIYGVTYWNGNTSTRPDITVTDGTLSSTLTGSGVITVFGKTSAPLTYIQVLQNWLTGVLDQNGDGKVNSVDFGTLIP